PRAAAPPGEPLGRRPSRRRHGLSLRHGLVRPAGIRRRLYVPEGRRPREDSRAQRGPPAEAEPATDYLSAASGVPSFHGSATSYGRRRQSSGRHSIGAKSRWAMYSGRLNLRMWLETAQRLRRSEEHTSELQSHLNLVCRLLLEKKKI